MPGTLEAYYQEAGRAGRDGRPAECLLLFAFQDRKIQESFIETYERLEHVARFSLDLLAARYARASPSSLKASRQR